MFHFPFLLYIEWVMYEMGKLEIFPAALEVIYRK
jgi:hypothetical protein